ncbi:MAG TPA: SDR family oxidoreductase [Saprospiraceae bacterium]|nr:SDR family oxidoreductase [Saprospiraceae bacterium]
MKVLVLGSTGLLGYNISKKALELGHEVYAFHRPTSEIQPLLTLKGIQRVVGDIKEPQSLEVAVKGMDVVISTANAVSPRYKTDTFKAIDRDGNIALIEAAKKASIRQFIYTSAISFQHYDKQIPLSKVKRAVEKKLMESGVNYTIFRPAAFMDIYFAFFGTDIVLNNNPAHSLTRDYPFARKFFNGIRNDIVQKGQFNLSGKGDKRTSFISVNDVAEFHVRAIGNTKVYNRIIEIGGPQSLTPLEVKAIFEKHLNVHLKTKTTPPFVLNIISKILSPFNEHASNIMALNYVNTQTDSIIDDTEMIAEEFGIKLTSAEDYIASKIKISDF